MLRRDGLAEADESMWNAKALELMGSSGDKASWRIADHRDQAAVSRAMAQGIVYRPVEEIAALPDLEEIVERLIVQDVRSSCGSLGMGSEDEIVRDDDARMPKASEGG